MRLRMASGSSPNAAAISFHVRPWEWRISNATRSPRVSVRARRRNTTFTSSRDATSWDGVLGTAVGNNGDRRPSSVGSGSLWWRTPLRTWSMYPWSSTL